MTAQRTSFLSLAPPAICLSIIVGASVLLPMGGVFVGIFRGHAGAGGPTPSLSPLLTSLGYAVLIGTLATTMAWPVAWRIHDRPGRWLAFTLMPLVAPAYLAYAGLGLVIAPRTWLGNILLEQGGDWPAMATRAIAVIALAMWSWPVACLAMCMALRRLDAAMFDSLKLEPASPWSRLRFRLGAARVGLVASVILTALIMLGTVTPLHLARVATYAIELWAMLASTPADQQWRVHLAAWPLVVGAFGGAMVVLAGLSKWAALHSTTPEVESRRTFWWRVAPLAGVGLSIGVPAALLTFDLSRARVPGQSTSVLEAIRVFLRVHGDALSDSLLVSVFVFGAGLVIGLSVSLLEHVTSRRSRLSQVAVACLLTSALIPGVLVGSAIIRTFISVPVLRPVLDWPGIVALGHIARFGFIPAMVALWMSRTTPPDLTALRRLEGTDSMIGWWRTTLGMHLAPIAGGALVSALLSLHEIEAAVMLAPPGADSLARRMLEMLHFARLRELTAGTLVLLGLATLSGLILVGLGGFAGSRRTVTRGGP